MTEAWWGTCQHDHKRQWMCGPCVEEQISVLEAKVKTRTLDIDKALFVERVIDQAYNELRRQDERISKRMWREFRRAAIYIADSCQ